MGLLKDRFLKLPIKQPLSREAKNGIRFLLDDRGVEPENILQALNRIRALYFATFTTYPHYALLEFYTNKGPASSKLEKSQYDLKIKLQKLKKASRICKIPASSISFDSKYSDEDPEMLQSYYAFAINKEDSKNDITELLWLSFASECPHWMRPAIFFSLYFYDPVRKILLHPYDMRGADLIADNKENIFECGKEFEDWIIETNMSF